MDKPQVVDGLPFVQADGDGLPEGAEGDFRDFAQASKALDSILAALKEGEFCTAADLERVSTDIAAIRADMTAGYEKQESQINERVAESIAAGNKDVLEQVRTTVGDMLKGQPAAQATAQPTGWESVQANVRQEGRSPGPSSGEFSGGRNTVVLWADIRRPQRQVQAASMQNVVLPVAGVEGITGMAPWIYYQEGDPFMDVALMVYPDNPSFNLPSLAQPSSPVKNRAGGSLVGGRLPVEPVDIASGTNAADFWEKVMAYPGIKDDDITMLRDMVTQNMLQTFAATWGADVAATVKAGVSQVVKTGKAGGLPTIANFPGKIADVLASVKSFYRMGASWQLNEQVEALWNSQWSASGGIDPESNRGTLLGFPKAINSHLDEGGTGDDISAHFGNWRMSLVEALFKDVEIRYYDQTVPGDMTIYGCFRGKSAIMNTEAYASLKTAA